MTPRLIISLIHASTHIEFLDKCQDPFSARMILSAVRVCWRITAFSTMENFRYDVNPYINNDTHSRPGPSPIDWCTHRLERELRLL